MASAPPLTIASRDLGDGVRAFRLAGEADLAGAPELKAAIFGALDDGASHVVLEMSEVSFIDSAILAVMVGTHKRVRANGGSIKIVAPSESVREILEMTGMDGVIPVVDEE